MFRTENRAIYDVMGGGGEETVEPVVDNNVMPRMRFACDIPKGTDTHSEYIILTAFPCCQWLRKGASTLRYTYFSCLVYFAR
jgi:hypothetical protein